MRGLKVFLDLPSCVMRRVLRSFYDEDITDHALFEKNLLPVYHPGTPPLASAVPLEAPPVSTPGTVGMPSLPDNLGWEGMIDLSYVDTLDPLM